MSLRIDQIRLDGGTQSRAAINAATVDDYAEAMADPNTVFPPVTVYFDGKDYWLADGFHRLAAWAKIGRTDIPTEIRQGDRRRAILHSVAANAAHGLRRTNDDKRRAVLTLLEDPEWSQWSENQIAKQCGVSRTLVAKVIEEHGYLAEKQDSGSVKVVTRNGTTYQQNTANIGGGPRADQKAEPQQTQAEGIAGGVERASASNNDREPAEPSEESRKPRAGRELTREALEEDLAALREENANLKAAITARDVRIADLEAHVAELSHSETGQVISRLREQRDRERTAKGKKMDELAVMARKLRAADARIADLERARQKEVVSL